MTAGGEIWVTVDSSLTTRLAGDARPKQFCALTGGETCSMRVAGAPIF